MKILCRAAEFCYDRIRCRLPRAFGSPQVKKDLESLRPGEDREESCRKFYVEKLEKSMLIIAAGIALAILLAVRAKSEKRPDSENAFLRGDFAEDVREMTVETVVDGSKEQFRIPVWARQPDEKEAEELRQKFRQELPQLILGENASLREVRKKLELSERFEGYPFRVEWKSASPESIDSSGAVYPLEESREVGLTAGITCGEAEWEEQLMAVVPAAELTEPERRRREIEKLLIASELESRESEYWVMPDRWEGEAITWSRTVEDYSGIIGAGAILVGIAIYFLKDKDLHDELLKRRACMKRDYPDIVHKLALYLGAGMTLRGAFQKIADEYGNSRASGCPEAPAYEEMVYACRELRSGISEQEVYERFGKRTGLQEYIRLCTLLAQNLKRGNNTLLQRLHEEADRACQERIQSSRKLGEEASTRLLIPMVMMLAVVMVMVMLPAFYSMGM